MYHNHHKFDKGDIVRWIEFNLGSRVYRPNGLAVVLDVRFRYERRAFDPFKNFEIDQCHVMCDEWIEWVDSDLLEIAACKLSSAVV